MIHEEIVTSEVAKLAKEKGFPQHIGNDAYVVENEYDDEYEVGCCCPIQFIPDYLPTITAPTQSILQRWLREEKGIIVDVVLDWQYNIEAGEIRYQYRIGSVDRMTIEGGIKTKGLVFDKRFTTYELALEDALKYSLENLV